MPKSMRKQFIFAALQAAENTAVTAFTANDAILTSSVTLSPLEGSSISRDFIRPYYGNAGEIRVEKYVKIDFETELAGNATAGSLPIWATLLKACNYQQFNNAHILHNDVTGTASTTTAIKLGATASATNDFYKDQYLFIGNEFRKIAGYVGTTKVATLVSALTNTPADSSPYRVGVPFTPVSSIEWGNAIAADKSRSATIYFQLDRDGSGNGTKHGLANARGTFSLDMSAKKIPKIKWSFTGLLIPVVEGQIVPVSTPIDFSQWGIPHETGTLYTRNASLHNTPISMIDSLTLDIANDVKYRGLIGGENVYITDRKPKGAISFEFTGVATKNWFTAAQNNDIAPFSFSHGSVADHAFYFEMPRVQVQNPKYSDSDGIAMIGMDLSILPNVGNDEFTLAIF